ncbi:MAG TPA: hypothetical protein DCM40_39270 [Maribacter sp.]|uniref:Uncharacterized protein n=1 Tax=Flagellimonas alvinocaridis TaxID=2530200 RepID=A0A4V4HWG3_9FLAO|nr:hypothetical protein EZV76_16115 [Allomuricauda alvinocaridis]HAI43714.1 hypothetical protein [Maribacter sp.]
MIFLVLSYFVVKEGGRNLNWTIGRKGSRFKYSHLLFFSAFFTNSFQYKVHIVHFIIVWQAFFRYFIW